MSIQKGQIAKFSFIVSLLIIGSFVVALLDIKEVFRVLESWIFQVGAWAPFLFGVVYTLFTVFFLPTLQLNVLAGIAFGGVWGSIYVTIAAMFAFVLSLLTDIWLYFFWKV